MVIGDIEIPAYVLEDETRVLTQRGVFTAFDTRRGGHYRVGAELPRFLATKALAPHITGVLRLALTKPILFTLSSGPVAHGYPATLLPDICGVILQARSDGDLNHRQRGLAERSELLLRGLAHVGIIALVDEATGYQRIREERALATILEEFLDKELQPWTRTFPFTFYEQIFRLKGWGNAAGVKRPSVIGHYTNDFVYDRIAPGVLDELRSRNPVLPQDGAGIVITSGSPRNTGILGSRSTLKASRHSCGWRGVGMVSCAASTTFTLSWAHNSRWRLATTMKGAFSMAAPNFADKTVWTGDNLDILRGMNSECVDLIYLDPPFNSNQN